MSIRVKLFALLLGVVLIPILIVGWFDHRALRTLGEVLATQTRDTLTAQVTARLLEEVEREAAAMRDRGRIVALAVSHQAAAVERRLAGPPPLDVTVTPVEMFGSDPPRAPGLEESTVHARLAGTGPPGPLLISTAAVAILNVTGIDPAAVADDAARLAAMLPTLQRLYADHSDLIFWSFTSLENGVHAVFPGHGSFPRGYDPRTRPWYQVIRETGEAAWTAATVDVATGHILAIYAAPVHGPEGDFTGVTGIAVSVASILSEAVANAPRTSGVGAYIVFPEVPADGRGPGLRIYVEWDPERETAVPPAGIGWLEDPGNTAFADVQGHIRRGGTAVQRMGFQDQEVLLAYAPLDDVPNMLVLVVPYREAVAAAINMGTVVEAQTDAQLERLGLALAGIILVVALVVAISARTISRPVEQLVLAARRIARGDLTARAEIDRRDEIGELAASFNAMVPQLADQLKVRESLRLAMEVQQNLLPAAAPAVPGYDIAGRSRYCDETGGDYYDFIDLTDLGDGQVGIAIGDVSGHGVAAALLMTTARALLRGRADQPDMLARGAVGRLMTDVNRHLSRDVHRGRFMSLIYMVLDARIGQLCWASAGHEPVLLLEAGSRVFRELDDSGGIPLGIDPAWEYAEDQIQLEQSGTVLFAGTDGIWECRCPEGRMFGRDAMKAVVRDHADRSAAEICAAVDAAVESHRQGRPAADDRTMVVIKVS